MLVARGPTGELAVYPAVENHHRDGILDWSVAPARLPGAVTEAAQAAACRLAEHLELVGLACLECFVTGDATGNGGLRVLANEMAPRPHNSGHLTIEAAETSQFHQQLRAVCGLPLGGTAPPPAGGDGEPARRPVVGGRARLGGGVVGARCLAPPVRQGRGAART